MSDPDYCAYLAERRQFWEEFAKNSDRWTTPARYYRQRLTELYRFMIPAGSRVLELGCGEGNLLAALRPTYGVGIDLSERRVACARARNPGIRFEVADAQNFCLDETFDFVICSDLLNELWDVEAFFRVVGKHSHAATRLIMNCHSRLWELPRRAAETLGIIKRQLRQNWLRVEDIHNLLRLADFEMIRSSSEIMCPIRLPLLDGPLNKYLVKFWPFRHLGITNFVVARPVPNPKRDVVVSVVVPARNEEGNIGHIFERVPQMGARTELIFVEGHSSDATYEHIVREIAARPQCDAKLFRQTGKGKGDAVRLGFAEASGDVLMILDADMTVPPEDLNRFYEAWRSGKGEFINGVRLVYPMNERAMRFINMLGNRFFSLAFTWILGQTIRDTLCGTKVLSRDHYRIIAENRAYFGNFDPFGDFDLIFGAAHYNLKIVDMPIRYRERTYGTTNIQRWRHGWLLLKMLGVGARRLKFV